MSFTISSSITGLGNKDYHTIFQIGIGLLFWFTNVESKISADIY